jgi:hypothetical protein
MKTIGRILIILAVFFALSGLMVVAVNASGANAPDFGGALPQIRPGGDDSGVRPEGGDENRPERGERGGSGSRWMFGPVKNVGVMAVLVTIIVWPKSMAKKKRKQAGIKSANGES